MSSTVIIPARGNSKGLRGKNLRLCGRCTLLGRAIGTCLMAGCVDRIIVSTDNHEIAAEAERQGAKVLRRPSHLATSEASSQDVLRHAITTAHVDGTFAFVQCTNPFLAGVDIGRCLAAAENCDLAVCVTPSHALLVDEDGEPLNWTTDALRRQDRAQQWRIAGSCWAMSTDYCLTEQLYSGSVVPVPASCPYQVDIDTADDLRMAEALLCMS